MEFYLTQWQQRARTAWLPEEARKKYRGDYAQDNDLKDSVSSSAEACVIVGSFTSKILNILGSFDSQTVSRAR